MGCGLWGHKELDTTERLTYTHSKSRLSFERNYPAVFHVAAPCCILISSESSWCFTALPTFDVVGTLDSGCLSRCVMVVVVV